MLKPNTQSSITFNNTNSNYRTSYDARNNKNTYQNQIRINEQQQQQNQQLNQNSVKNSISTNKMLNEINKDKYQNPNFNQNYAYQSPKSSNIMRSQKYIKNYPIMNEEQNKEFNKKSQYVSPGPRRQNLMQKNERNSIDKSKELPFFKANKNNKNNRFDVNYQPYNSNNSYVKKIPSSASHNIISDQLQSYSVSPYAQINQQPYGKITHQNINQLQSTKLISQLRLSLHQSLQSQRLLQQQLNKQKSSTYQLLAIKRRLQEQLSKMQFQLDRINSTQLLTQKQVSIKNQSLHNQNLKLKNQVNQLYDEIKKQRKQHRQLMTEFNKISAEKEIFQKDNQELVKKIEELSHQINLIKEELIMVNNQEKINGNRNYAYNMNINANSQSHLNQITTTRTNDIESRLTSIQNISPYKLSLMRVGAGNMAGNNNKKSQFTIKNYNYNEDNINYDLQNSKLLQQYNNLAMQNQSMKKLYRQFYQSPTSNIQNNNQLFFKSPKNVQPISQYHQQFQQTNKGRENNEINFQNQKIKTYQKRQLKQQIDLLREQVIRDVLAKYYHRIVNQSSKMSKNCLVLFIQEMTKNLQLINKMVVNYLMARDMYKQQLGIKRLPQGDPQNEQDSKIQVIFDKVKQKLKGDVKNTSDFDSQAIALNINAYYLAVFRLLTLISKHQSNYSSQTVSKLKHYCLKYIHRIYQESYKLKQNSLQAKQKNINKQLTSPKNNLIYSLSKK